MRFSLVNMTVNFISHRFSFYMEVRGLSIQRIRGTEILKVFFFVKDLTRINAYILSEMFHKVASKVNLPLKK